MSFKLKIMTLITLFITSSTLMTLTWVNMSWNNPMNTSLLILTTAILLSLMYALMLSSWFALMLFLIYVGGMMVMFSYFVSLSSNDSTTLKNNIHMFIIPFLLTKTMNTEPHLSLFSASQLNLLYSPMNMTIIILFTIFLLMIMIVVTKLVKVANAPLRGFMGKN